MKLAGEMNSHVCSPDVETRAGLLSRKVENTRPKSS
jgi:hypothetical protein